MNIKQMSQQFKKTKSFTLIEIIVTIVILSVIASMAMVNYNGMLIKAREKRARKDLILISSALEIYNTKYGRYPSAELDSQDRGAVNQLLGLNIPDEEWVWEIEMTTTTYAIKLKRADYRWQLEQTTITDCSDSYCSGVNNNPRCIPDQTPCYRAF